MPVLVVFCAGVITSTNAGPSEGGDWNEVKQNNTISSLKTLGQYDRPRVLGCEPVDGVHDGLSSNQLNITTFVHQMGDMYVSHVLISSNQLNITMFVQQMGDMCLPPGEQNWQYLIELN